MDLKTLIGVNASREFLDALGHLTERSGNAGAAATSTVERYECRRCEGSGRIEFGGFGSYFRDGEVYEAPGVEDCNACDGAGFIEEPNPSF